LHVIGRRQRGRHGAFEGRHGFQIGKRDGRRNGELGNEGLDGRNGHRRGIDDGKERRGVGLFDERRGVDERGHAVGTGGEQ